MNKPGTITVVTNFTPKAAGAVRIPIGRPSIFGNPFVLRNEEQRKSVIVRYRTYLTTKYKEDERFRHALEDLANKVLAGQNLELVCYCAPRPCHGDIIKRAVELILAEAMKDDGTN